MGSAKAGAGNPSGSSNTVVSPVSDTSGGSINPFTALLSPTLWLRISAFIMGGALLIFALLKLTGTDQTIISATKKAIKTTAEVAVI